MSMLQYIIKLEDEYSKLENEILDKSILLNDVRSKIMNTRLLNMEYQGWLLGGEYEDKGLGYFNCLPTELVYLISSFIYHNGVGVCQNRLPETCKSLTYLLYDQFRKKAVKRLGRSISYLDEKYPDDYETWYSILCCTKEFGERVYIGNEYIIELGSIETCDHNGVGNVKAHDLGNIKIYNYSDEEWHHYGQNFYANYRGVAVLYSSLYVNRFSGYSMMSITIKYDGDIFLIEDVNKILSGVSWMPVYIPTTNIYCNKHFIPSDKLKENWSRYLYVMDAGKMYYPDRGKIMDIHDNSV